jgi:hypothetical protein
MVDVIGRAKVIVTSDVDQRSVDQTGTKIGAGLKQGALIGGGRHIRRSKLLRHSHGN